MFNDDSLEVRQENEIQALKAIFNDDLRDLRCSKPWKTWKPLDIVLQLSPLQGSTGLQEIHAQVDLHIICSENYPNQEPDILLEKSRGVSDVLLKELKEQLEKKASELKGEVMVFELAQHVQAFLHEHNKPSYKSFYEEMLSRQLEQQQLKEQAKQLEEDRERQVMQTEIHRRQEILRSEVKYRRDYGLSTSDNQDVSPNNSSKKNTRKSVSSTSEYSEENLCEHKGTELIVFESNVERKVQKGRCLSHSDRGCVIYSGLDLNSGEIYAITEWKVNIKDHSYNLKQIHSSEQEFTYLSKLKNYNLVRYLAIKYVHVKDEIIIYILQEFVLGANCNAIFIKENVPADVDMLRYIACGVLSALDFLHRNNVVHKELRDSCIFFDNNGIIKVSGYSLEVKLWELASQTQNTEYYSKKTDIYKFGLFMLSLLKGSDTDAAEISSSLPQDLFDFLSKCLVKDEKSRFNACQLLQHQFVRTPLQRMSPQRTYKEILPQVISSGQQSTTDLKFLSQNRSGGPSRIQNEFEVLQWLGKGAFGDVLKVRNKLDGGYYAIKRIELNPKNRQLNRKITREVKLLSRLNHENVVRYYNSWIESAVLEPDQSGSSTEPSLEIPKRHVTKKEELSFGDDIELLAPPIKDIEWSISYESKSKHNVENSAQSSSEDESSDDDDDDDDDWVNFLPNNADSSDSIEFERSANNANESDTISDVNDTKPSACSSRLTREIQFMYIQMEFCEKSTLRTAIDDGLHLDMDRVWRLFREIVEGLAHIHQQGMIHRDLKPVNIFLDLNDHVKIGDFGLATTNILPRPSTTTETLNKSIIESEKEMSQSQDVDGSMTGHIGTALYVAPELNATSKAIYNQKVDIYSLGIILFEMCYSGLNTGMERIKVLSNMRLKEIIYPQDFFDQKYSKQRTVISWLLNHDVNQRPTSQELLQSEYIPPPILEECELRELVRHTLSNPQSKTYKYLVASCFEQELNYVDDITYYMSLTPIPARILQLREYVKDAVVKIFKLHGGQSLSTPLLLPKNNYYEGVESCVKLMTHSGSVISIPHDLRIPFARYVACNGITLLKRYSIGRVYREKKVFGYHPRELYECAFDIVTPTPGTLLADAELLSIVSEIVNEFNVLKNKNFIIRLNHTMLLRAVLLHCGIPSEKHNDIYSILSEARDGKVTKFQIRTHLISLCLTDNAMVTLFSLIETETSINKVANTLRMITKRKGEASQLAKQGLNELSQIIQNAEALGIKYTINVALGLVHNVQQYSGMMCQFVCELKKKRRRGGLDVLAAGGRYDCMLNNQRLIMERSGMTSRGVSQSAVGISISLDKFVQALQEEQSDEIEGLCNLDVIVCSLGTRPMPKEKAKILKELWSVGIKCNVLEAQTLEEIQEQCTESHVPHIVILKDTEQGIVRVRSWEKDRFQERKINLNELVEFMQKLIKSWNEGSTSESNTYNNYNMNTGISRMESRTSINEQQTHTTTSYTTAVIVNFVTSPNGKLAANTRKRLENQILSQMESTIQRFSTKEQIVVLALNVESSVIKSLSSYLDLESDESVQKSINSVIEKHPRHKKYLVQISDEILDYLSCKTRPIISLYSLPDAIFKILL